MSSDRRHGVTMIAFIGSVFSPYYALARRRGPADPENHVAINVALYGQGARRWCMTERGVAGMTRDRDHLAIGPSQVAWSGGELVINIDEIAVPLPRRVRGTIRVRPASIIAERFHLDAAQRHVWHPIAPVADVEVRLDHPALHWSGRGYFDHNHGSEPLERAFVRWDWARASTPSGARIVYDTTRRGASGDEQPLALDIARDGRVTPIDPGVRAALPTSTVWRVGRAMRCVGAAAPAVAETLEDTPFYARSVVTSTLGGTRDTYMHESLDLDRFAAPVVQAMLPFRMPRRAG